MHHSIKCPHPCNLQGPKETVPADMLNSSCDQQYKKDANVKIEKVKIKYIDTQKSCNVQNELSG